MDGKSPRPPDATEKGPVNEVELEPMRPAEESNEAPTEDELRERYRFWAMTAEDVTPLELPALLSEYKRLVLVEVNMRKRAERERKMIDAASKRTH
jgi:hypothetical protein